MIRQLFDILKLHYEMSYPVFEKSQMLLCIFQNVWNIHKYHQKTECYIYFLNLHRRHNKDIYIHFEVVFATAAHTEKVKQSNWED